MSWRRSTLGLILVAASCSDAPKDPEPVSELAAVENPANALSYYIQWETAEPMATALEVDCGPDYQQAFQGEEPVTAHEVFVMGLIDGSTCEVRAQPEMTGAPAAATTTLEVGPLPDALPATDVVTNAEDVQSGWTLFNLAPVGQGGPLKVVMVDRKGRYRWYYEIDRNESGSDNDVRMVSDGVLIGGTWGNVYPTRVDWEGQILWQREMFMHHDLRPDPAGDGNQLLYLDVTRCPPDETMVNSVNVYDLERDERTWTWRLCDHYTPDAIVDDWDHQNTIEPFPDEPALLISARNQELLVKMNRDTEDIEWTMGKGGDIELPEGEAFYHQHAPEIQPDGNIVLYDNGLAGVREYSRGIEIAYDAETQEAEVVWEFRPEPDIFTPIWGDADRLENGNTLMTFGRRAPGTDSHIIEADAEANEVWHLKFPERWGIYRAERVTAPPRGHVIE